MGEYSVLKNNNNSIILLLFFITKICFAFSVFQVYLNPTTVLVFVSFIQHVPHSSKPRNTIKNPKRAILPLRTNIPEKQSISLN